MRVNREENQASNLIEAMKAKVDSEWGRYFYNWRLGIVEPVFGNVRWALGLDWFSLRGKQKEKGPMEANGYTSQPVEASKIRNDRMRGDEPEDRSGIFTVEQVCSKNRKVFLGCKS